MSEYPPVVAELLTLGEKGLRDREWLDYRARGLGSEHVPDLIRIVQTWTLNEDAPEGPQLWAPIHAWRALGQLRAAEASEELLRAVRDEVESDFSDWAGNEMPVVFGMIGPAALPVLATGLRDPSADYFLRWIVAESMAKIGQQHPEARAECVALLTGQLEKASENDPTLNGGLVSTLLDLKAVEAAPVLEQAFATGNVDESIAGGWEDVRYELGLGPPPARRSRSPIFVGDVMPRGRSPKTRAQDRARNRRKQAKQSRKRNRKKKK
jgi:hypothetical protein